jgi:drug/metabolite transporter (DMT)-like permease
LSDRSALLANLGSIVGSCLVGAAVVATRSAVDEIEPFGLAFLRYLQGAIVLFAVLRLRGSNHIRIPAPELRSIAILGLLMYALFPVLFNTALTFTTASRGAVILATMPLWTALLARRFARESLRTGQILGVLVSITGVMVVFAESGLGDLGGRDAFLGNTMMLMAAMVAAIYGVRIKSVLVNHGALDVTAYAMAFGAAALFIPAMIEGLPGALASASRNTLLLVLYLGVGGGAIAFWLFSVALARLSPTQAIVYVNLNPMVATLLASIFLDEPLTIFFGIGFALVVSGLLLTNIPPRKRASIRAVMRTPG